MLSNQLYKNTIKSRINKGTWRDGLQNISRIQPIDAPDFPPFKGDPEKLKNLVDNPDRVALLAPGEPFTLKKL